MKKLISLTEEELRDLIMEKIENVVNGNLGYSPAIGNKKRGPGDDIDDQMTKRRNKKLDEEQGTHDQSVIYDDVYSYIEDDLDRWKAGPVYGWRGSKGVAFSAVKPDQHDAWIVVTMMGFNGYYNDDSFLVTVSPYGTDDPDEADDYKAYVYAGDLVRAIDSLLGYGQLNESIHDQSLFDIGEESGNHVIEISESAYEYAFEEIYGRAPGNLAEVLEEEGLPEEVTINFRLSISRSGGDGYYDQDRTLYELEDWDIDQESIGWLPNLELADVVRKAVEYELESLTPSELHSELAMMNESIDRCVGEEIKSFTSKRLNEGRQFREFLDDMQRCADPFEFLAVAKGKYGLSRDEMEDLGYLNIWRRLHHNYDEEF